MNDALWEVKKEVIELQTERSITRIWLVCLFAICLVNTCGDSANELRLIALEQEHVEVVDDDA